MPRIVRISRSRTSRSAASTFPPHTVSTPQAFKWAMDSLRADHDQSEMETELGTAIIAPSRTGSRLLKNHECAVSYPDGTSGVCKYTRGGPAFHVFVFEHPQGNLPVQRGLERMDNTPQGIEARAADLARDAFAQAILCERRNRFCRATTPMGYNPYDRDWTAPPPRPQMSVGRAKELAGKYALCIALGEGATRRYLPCNGVTFDTLDEAIKAWEQSAQRSSRFLACLCRYTRQWELPVYNPLHANTEYATLLGIKEKAVTFPTV